MGRSRKGWRGGGKEHLRRGQSPASGGLGAATGSAAAAPPEVEGANDKRWASPGHSLPLPTPHLVEVPQSAPQVVEVPHPPGCGVVTASDHSRAPSGTGSSVCTGAIGGRED